MRTTKKETREHVVTDDVFCNKCGASCRQEVPSMSAPPWYVFCGLIEATVVGEYLSPKLADMTQYTFSLCEACLVALFDTFVHKAEVESAYE